MCRYPWFSPACLHCLYFHLVKPLKPKNPRTRDTTLVWQKLGKLPVCQNYTLHYILWFVSTLSFNPVQHTTVVQLKAPDLSIYTLQRETLSTTLILFTHILIYILPHPYFLFLNSPQLFFSPIFIHPELLSIIRNKKQ